MAFQGRCQITKYLGKSEPECKIVQNEYPGSVEQTREYKENFRHVVDSILADCGAEDFANHTMLLSFSVRIHHHFPNSLSFSAEVWFGRSKCKVVRFVAACSSRFVFYLDWVSFLYFCCYIR
jgi:hypothetical protein